MLMRDSLACGLTRDGGTAMRRGALAGTVMALGLAVGAPAWAAAVDAGRMVEASPGVQIRVIDAGPKDAALTLVLVPGWRFTADIWAEQIAAFAGRYRVIAIDPRSQGASTKAVDGNTPEDRAADLHAVLGRLAVGAKVLVGWSQGAQDVGVYAARFGADGVRGLVFVDAAPSQGWETSTASPGAAQQLKNLSLYAHYPRDATEAMMHAVFRSPQPPAVFDGLVASALKTPPSIGAAMLADDLFGPDRLSALAKVDLPALLVAADASPNAADLAALAKVLPRAHQVTVAGAGHAVFVDRPQAFDELLAGFVRSL